MRKLRPVVSSDGDKQADSVQLPLLGDRIKARLRAKAKSKKRKRDLERRRERYRTDPAYRERQKLRKKFRVIGAAEVERRRISQKLRYQQNREKLLAYKEKYREEKREILRERSRDHYERNKERYLAEERARRDRRNPARIVRRLSKDLAEGRIEVCAAVEQIRKQIADIDGRIRERAGQGSVVGRQKKS